MKKLFKTIDVWLKVHSLAPEQAIKPTTHQEINLSKGAVARFNASFDRQQAAMQARAMTPHGADCADSWTCNNPNCFKWEPDRIVSKPYEVPMRKALK